jgi:hypothetical protein
MGSRLEHFLILLENLKNTSRISLNPTFRGCKVFPNSPTKTMQQGHAVTWTEFKQAFKSHHIPKGLMDRKMRELLALKQGSDTVYHYA